MILDINEANIIRIGNMLENLVASVDVLSEHVKNAPPVKIEQKPRPGTPLDCMAYPKEWRIKRFRKYSMDLIKSLKKNFNISEKEIQDTMDKYINCDIKEETDPDKLRELFYALLSMEARAYEVRELTKDN